MLSSTVEVNVDSARALPQTDVTTVRSPPDPGINDMSLDTRVLAPLPLETSASAVAVKTQPALSTATTLTAKAVDIDILAAPDLILDLASFELPAFDEGEVPACLPAGNMD